MMVLLQTYASASFIGLSPSQLEEKISKNIKVIDIRTPMEWNETGIIPNSHKIMFFAPDGKYDIQKWLDDLSNVIKDQNEPFVLVCRHGNRTKIVGDFLSSKLKFKNVFHLEHGIVSWIKENRKLVK
jgi:rhodanese-related sulfurtransferase